MTNSLESELGTRNGNVQITRINKNSRINLICDCGESFTTDKRSFLKGNITSCGCGMYGFIPGQKVLTWTLERRGNIELAHERKKVYVICDCGLQKFVSIDSFAYGSITHVCPYTEGVIGQRFGRLVVTGLTGGKRGAALEYQTVCDCGTAKVAILSELRRGNVRSCGCLQREIASARGKAGMPRTELPGYAYAHRLVAKARGKADTHMCEHCEVSVAQQWAYDHEDPNEIVALQVFKNCVYSTDPNHYIPLCIPCHREFDSKEARQLIELVEVRAKQSPC